VAGADGDGQRVNAGALGELDRLVGVSDVFEPCRQRRGRLQRASSRFASSGDARSCAKSTSFLVPRHFFKGGGVLPSSLSSRHHYAGVAS